MNKHRRGFTLVELLVVMTIIGLLSTIATVNYSSSRMKARDARRLADMDAFRTALELYNTNQGGFPGDKAEGRRVWFWEAPAGKRFSSIGFSDKLVGEIYMETIPSNPLGGGANYLYYSLNNDGTHCVLDVVRLTALNLFWKRRKTLLPRARTLQLQAARPRIAGRGRQDSRAYRCFARRPVNDRGFAGHRFDRRDHKSSAKRSDGRVGFK